MTVASAKIIADSITDDGHRLTSIQETFWRPVLAERNTHTSQGKNSASSRAIPFEKQLEKFRNDFAEPVSWPAEQPGMQGGEELTGADLADAKDLWEMIRQDILARMDCYLADHPKGCPVTCDKDHVHVSHTRVHKSVLNRVIEYGQWHTAIVTATAWENYFDLRTDLDAQPEIREVALAAQQAYRESTPQLLKPGEWHLPYVDAETRAEVVAIHPDDEQLQMQMLTKISSARCARLSYLTQDGKRDIREEIDLYDKLITLRSDIGKPLHWSPLQHVATPWAFNRLRVGLPFRALDGETYETQADVPYIGNLVGWRSLRTEVESVLGYGTFR